MRKTLVIAAAIALALAGCASLQNAGTAEYSVKPFVIDKESGALACCEVLVKNGKEIASLEAHIEKKGENYVVNLKEQGVAAFKGQAIAAGATQAAIDAAAKAASAALALPGLGAAAVGAAATVGIEKVKGVARD